MKLLKFIFRKNIDFENQSIVEEKSNQQAVNYTTLLAMLEEQIQQAMTHNDDRRIAQYTVEKAVIYHMANKSDRALSLLEEVMPDLEGVFQTYVDKWHCSISLQQAAKVGKLTSMEYEQEAKACMRVADSYLAAGEANVKEKEDERKQWRIYPNPNNGQFEISLNSEFKQSIDHMALYDMTGKVVADLSDKWSVDNRILFDGQHLPEGIYFLKARTPNLSMVEKILIAK